MTKPQMIRADTIDLQDQHSPSAKDHSRQPTSPAPLGDGPPAPHQAATLRNASLDEHTLHSRSPRASQDLSGKELQLLHEHSDVDEQDAAEIEASLGLQRNGENGAQHMHGQNGEIDDEGDEEGLDDDMMDKISSSPSIEDGGYPHRPWPARADSLMRCHASKSSSKDSSSLLPVAPEMAPSSLQEEAEALGTGHHRLGEYGEDELVGPSISTAVVDSESTSATSIQARKATLRSYGENVHDNSYDDSFEDCDLDHLPTSKYEAGFYNLYGGSMSNHSLLLRDDDDSGYEDYEEYEVADEIDGCSHDDHHGLVMEDETDDDDDAEDISYDDARFVDSGWGGECLRDTEDIDFEFVYALHTFVATVEGQANATKGDTMVLLDDSNSYWWLVRVVKDGSIGYLPAEHIETPTERLARLNKHRNIDLSQTMLGDNPEKSRNPLKKAMRRRNAKNVQFAEPTYYEPSEVEYSTEEENEDEMEFLTTAEAAHEQGQAEQQQAQQESAVVEPLNVKSATQKDNQAQDRAAEAAQMESREDDDQEKSSTEIYDQSDDASAPKNARRMRNTDSFYKDDSIETRKISLTPNLLRDDSVSGSSTIVASDAARGSMEGSEKGSIEKTKEEKKKEKKPSKFSGLFKRKDKKKSQPETDDEEWMNKDSTPSSRQSPAPKVSSESTLAEVQATASPPKAQQPVRQTSKLQKVQPAKSNSLRRRDDHSAERPALTVEPVSDSSSNALKLEVQPISPPNLNPFEDTERIEPLQMHEPNGQDNSRQPPEPRQLTRTKTPEQAGSSPTSDTKRNVFNPLRDALRSAPAAAAAGNNEGRPEKVKKAKNRMAIDSSDESDEEHQTMSSSFPAAPQRQPPEPLTPPREISRLSESPVQVSPMVGAVQQPPGLVGDSSSHSDDAAVSPVSPSSTPELIERPPQEQQSSVHPSSTTTSSSKNFSSNTRNAQDPHPSSSFHTPPTQFQPLVDSNRNHNPSPTSTSNNNTPVSQRTANTTHTTSTAATQPATEWSDSMLRSYLESSSDDIRDLLVVVSDTSGVKVPGEEHPVVKSFGEERGRLVGMEARLDGLLRGLLEKRGIPAGGVR